MKKLFTFLFALILTSGLFASPGAEAETPAAAGDPIEISILYSPGGESDVAWATVELQKEYPNVTVTELVVDVSDGSLFTMTALQAADDTPNIYMDTLVRSSAFIRADFALPLDDYITDLDQYNEAELSAYRRDGALLGLPQPGSAQAMALNLDMMDEIGYVVPDNWTVADFLTMAARVNSYYGGEKYATGMFAANQSGDYLINNWFAAFGCEYYEAGDYSETTIKATGGGVVHHFFQDLMRDGYIPDDAADLTDDDYVLQWARGELAATAFFQPWIPYYQGVVADQGYEAFNYKFVPFPRAPWVDSVPTYYMTSAIVVHNTGTPEDAVAARLVQLLNSPKLQAEKAAKGSLPNRADVSAVPDDPHTAQIMEIVKANGVYDVGLTNEKYSATRPQHFPILQKVLNLSISPAESIAAYEAAINEALEW